MRAELPRLTHYKTHKGYQKEMEVLVVHEGEFGPEGGYYLFEMAVGASYRDMMDDATYISPNYSEEKHRKGEYCWIPARDCTLISDFENNQQALQFLRKD